MNFKAYDILSSILPGFLILIAGLDMLEMAFDKDLVVLYTALSFPLGYVANAISSWMEGIYFWSWGGQPSSELLSSRTAWKVPFFDGNKTRQLLIIDSGNPSATNAELFTYAMRYGGGDKDSKVEDLNANYVFSRNLLTTILLGSPFLFIRHHFDYRFYIILIPIIFVLWLRCKQRGYFYVRQILFNYLKSKQF